MPLRKRKTKQESEVPKEKKNDHVVAAPQDKKTCSTPSTDIATARSYSPDMKQMKKTKKKIKSFKTGVKVPILTFHNVDAVMAGLGMSLGLYTLKILEMVLPQILAAIPFVFSFFFSQDGTVMKLQLNSPLLIGSSAIFFFNRKPPSLKPFAHSTVVGILMGQALHTLNDIYLFHTFNDTICIFGMMVYFKLSGNTFGAATAMACILSTRPGSSPTDVPYAFLLAPYLLGHLSLYAMACTLSILRNFIRLKVMKQEFFAGEKSFLSKLDPEEREKRLLLLFRRMDLSGDGRLDVEEFQAAMKAVFWKEDVTLEDAQKVISFVDQNGDGSIDFEEFCMAIEKSEEVM